MLKFDFVFDVPNKTSYRAIGQFDNNSRLAILGPSGCGKSTFLKNLVGILPKRSGECTWQNQILDKQQLELGILGFCFQSSPLFTHLTVLENLIVPLESLKKFRRISPELMAQKALALLDQAKLSNLALRFPSDLSGGEKKRISLLRSLIFKAPLLILDEPFSDLDRDNRKLFKNWLQQILTSHQGVLLFVTHHESDIHDLANLRFDWPQNKENLLDFSKAQKI